jgi:hypothetical protein
MDKSAKHVSVETAAMTNLHVGAPPFISVFPTDTQQLHRFAFWEVEVLYFVTKRAGGSKVQ